MKIMDTEAVAQINDIFDLAARLRSAHMQWLVEQKGLTFDCKGFANVIENCAFSYTEALFLDIERQLSEDPEEAAKLRVPIPGEYDKVQAQIEAAAEQIKKANGGVFPQTAADGGPLD